MASAVKKIEQSNRLENGQGQSREIKMLLELGP